MALQTRRRRRAATVLQALVRGRSARIVFKKSIEANMESFWLDLRRCHDVYEKKRMRNLLGYDGTKLDRSGCHKVFLIRRIVEVSFSVCSKYHKKVKPLLHTHTINTQVRPWHAPPNHAHLHPMMSVDRPALSAMAYDDQEEEDDELTLSGITLVEGNSVTASDALGVGQGKAESKSEGELVSIEYTSLVRWLRSGKIRRPVTYAKMASAWVMTSVKHNRHAEDEFREDFEVESDGHDQNPGSADKAVHDTSMEVSKGGSYSESSNDGNGWVGCCDGAVLGGGLVVARRE